MEGKGDKRLRIAGWLLSFPILLCLTTGAARGEGLYTRTDELSCGDTRVQAFTTCTEDSHDIDTAVCTDQYFVFIDQKTGASVRMEGSGERAADRNLGAGGRAGTRYNGLVRDWACLEGRVGEYVYVGVIRVVATDKFDPWIELWDLKGRRLASTKGDHDGDSKRSNRIWKRFYRIWDSKHLPTHPLPDYAFVPIQLFRTDRVDP